MAIQLITLDNTQLGRLIKKIYDRVVKKSETTEVQSVGIDNSPTKNSTNLVESGGVFSALGKWGVVSQTQTWTGSDATGYDYTMSNQVYGLIPLSVLKEAEMVGATFNESTGYFEFNGLTDISYNEMNEILSTYPTSSLFSYGGVAAYRITRARTLCSIYNASQIGISWAFYGNNSLEVVVTKNRSRTVNYNANNIANAFGNMNHLKHVEGLVIDGVSASAAITGAFKNCYSLETCKMSRLKVDIGFSQSSRLSLESVYYLVHYAQNTSAITITLHATAYARCQADTTEYTYNEQTYTGILAYASAKNITIASA